MGLFLTSGVYLRRGAGLLAAAALLAWAPARADHHHEPAVLKALMLRNFVEFVRWPETPAELTLCGFGQDELGPAFDGLRGYRLQKSALAVRRQVGLGALGGCQVVYVSEAEKRQLPAILQAVQRRPVLVVADFPGGAQLGAALSLQVVGGRLAFDANFGAAQEAGLQLSSRLLQLAARVY